MQIRKLLCVGIVRQDDGVRYDGNDSQRKPQKLRRLRLLWIVQAYKNVLADQICIVAPRVLPGNGIEVVVAAEFEQDPTARSER